MRQRARGGCLLLDAQNGYQQVHHACSARISTALSRARHQVAWDYHAMVTLGIAQRLCYAALHASAMPAVAAAQGVGRRGLQADRLGR